MTRHVSSYVALALAVTQWLSVQWWTNKHTCYFSSCWNNLAGFYTTDGKGVDTCYSATIIRLMTSGVPAWCYICI